MPKDVTHPADTGARPAIEVLRSLVTLRANKDSMSRKEYKRQRTLLWMQAELTVETDTTAAKLAAPGEVHQHGGATITERPDLQYEAERDARTGNWRLDVTTEERDYLGRKLRDDRLNSVPAADRVLHKLGFPND